MKKDIVYIIMSLFAALLVGIGGYFLLSSELRGEPYIPSASDTVSVSSADGSPEATAEEHPENFCINIFASSVSVRSGAGDSFDAIGTAEQNQYFAYIGEQAADKKIWYEIDFGGTAGFVPSTAAKKIEKMPGSSDRYINDIAERYGVMGMQVAVIDCGTLTRTYEYGYAKYGVQEMRADTKIRCASLSKVALTMTAMQMSEEGLLDIDEDIGSYWGMRLHSPSFPDETVSLRSIFSHRSGIGELGYKDDMASQLRGGVFTKEHPNRDWRYCNYAFAVAGSTMEMAAQTTVPDYMQKHLLRPLGITAGYTGGNFGVSDIAELYRSDHKITRSTADQIGSGYVNEPGRHSNIFSGGLMISAGDLARIISVLAKDGVYGSARLLSRESVEMMEQKMFLQTDENGSTFYQCLPLRFQYGMYGGRGLYYHTGNAYGVLAFLSYDPESGDGMVVITTGANMSRDEYGVYSVCGEIAQYVYGSILK